MRRLVKTFSLWLGSCLWRDVSPKVVFYHDIGTRYTPMGTPLNVFRAHMSQIRKGDRVCFDDGFHGLFDARDELRRLDCPVTVFVAVRLIGMPGYLNREEMLLLQAEYGVDFQCHTWSHQTLVGPMIDESPRGERDDAWFEHELVESRTVLEQWLRKTVDELCFPVGYFSESVVERCRRAGYRKVYASYPGKLSDDYVQPRCLVQDLSPFGFRCTLGGGMCLLRKRYYARHYFGLE